MTSASEAGHLIHSHALYVRLTHCAWDSRIWCMTHTITHYAINLTQYKLAIKVPPLIHTGLCHVYFSLVINSVKEWPGSPGRLNAYVSTSSVVVDSTGDVDKSSLGGVADLVTALCCEVYNNNLPRVWRQLLATTECTRRKPWKPQTVFSLFNAWLLSHFLLLPSLMLNGTLSSILTIKLANPEPCHQFDPPPEVLKSNKHATLKYNRAHISKD